MKSREESKTEIQTTAADAAVPKAAGLLSDTSRSVPSFT